MPIMQFILNNYYNGNNMNLKKTSLLFVTSVFLLVTMFFASCAPKYDLSVDYGEGGAVTVSPDGTAFSENEVVTLEAVPDADYYFCCER